MSQPVSPTLPGAALGGGRLLRIANAADGATGAACRFVILATGIVLLGLLTANVVARYAFASGGFEFAQELPERIFPWFIMAGVALAVQHGGHMAVESVLARLGPVGARNLLVFGHVIVVASYIVLLRETMTVAGIMSIDKSPVLGLPSSYSYYALAAGCVALIVTTTALGIRVAMLGAAAMPTPAPEEVGT